MQVEDALRIVIRPYITEKTFDLIEKQNKIVFLVSGEATKSQVKQAIETLYEVSVDSVNTVKTIRGKKAYVRLTKGSPATESASKLELV